MYYITSQCEAQMRYEVNISLLNDGEIQESSCECTAGHSTSAHCKHVCITLFGLRDIYAKKSATTRQSTIQRLQTFHHPPKRYSGSPIRAKAMVRKNFKRKYFDIDQSEDPEYDSWYSNISKI